MHAWAHALSFLTVRMVIQPGVYAVCRLSAEEQTPEWARGGFCSITRTAGELSIVCAEECVPAEVRAERGYRILEVAGPLDFALVGVLASIADPLARAGISIFAISSFDTDFVLLRQERLADAIRALRDAGHEVA